MVLACDWSRYKDGTKMTPLELADQTMTFLMAGHETTRYIGASCQVAFQSVIVRNLTLLGSCM
mgnify:CR=1 FL=1